MNRSKYLELIKIKRNTFGPLSGSTPRFPRELSTIMKVPLNLNESRGSYSAKTLKEILREDLSKKYIEFSVGTSGAFFQTFLALSDQFEDVVIERPFYEPFYAVLKNLGFRTTFWTRTSNSKNDIESLKKIRGKRKILFITNPHFFHGFQLSVKELTNMASMFGALVIDESFHLQFSQNYELSTRLKADNAILLGGLSKSLGLSSLRLGWIGHSEIFSKNILSAGLLMHTDMPTMSLAIALRALRHRRKILRAIQDGFARNRDWIQREIVPNIQLSHNFERGHIGSVSYQVGNSSGLNSSLFGVEGFQRFRIDCESSQLRKFFGR